MATTVARLQAVLGADTGQFDRAMDQSEKRTRSFGSRLASVGKAGALAAGAAGIGALVYTLKTGIGEWAQSQKVAAQTEAVLKSTGASAHVTAKQVSDLATSLMKKSGIDDEAIASGENMLLTFTNIRNEVGKGNDIFTQSTSILTDMSTALGTDMSKQAIQLGKALNDPIKGVSALARVGVTFTAGQKDQIKAMVESGHTMDAQKLILRELNKEFGGSAEAAGKTLPGQIKILKEEFNNFAGDLVGKMIPVLQESIAWLKDHWPEISNAIDRFWADVKPILKSLIDIVIGVVKVFVDNWGTIGPIVTNIGQTIEAVVKTITSILKVFADLLRGDWSQAWADLKDAAGHAIDAIKLLIIGEFERMRLIMVTLGGKLLDGVVAGLQGIGEAAWGVINNIAEVAQNKLDNVKEWGAKVARNVVAGILGELQGIGGKAWDIINNIGSFITDKLDAAANWGISVGKAILGGIVSGIKGIGGAVGGAVVGIGTIVYNAYVRVLNTLIDKLNDLFEIDVPLPFGKHIKVDAPNIPHIPTLAEGGIVSRPTLALIGEAGPEAVVPLNKTAVPTVHVHYHGTVIQEREAAKTITSLLYRERSRGNPLLFRTG